MMPDSGMTEQDLDALLGEIQQLDPPPAPNALEFTSTMDKCLVTLRDKGFSWPYIAEWWKGKGWQGCDDTLRKRYQKLTADGK